MSDLANDPAFGPPLVRGVWQVRLANKADRADILRLRVSAFRRDPAAIDTDRFDAQCLHLWVGKAGQGPSATARLMVHKTPEDVLGGYAAQFYDLTRLASSGTPVLELGRLCTARGETDGDALRLLWAGVARIVLKSGAKRLIGSTSFPTTDPDRIAPALSVLAARHLGPKDLMPDVQAETAHHFEGSTPDPAGTAMLPPLLRSYLMLGGWVSDHIVIDKDLGTSHIFTCVDVEAMPAGRKRILGKMAEV